MIIKNKKGFSLVEVLMTIAMFALVMSTTNVMMYTSMKNARKVTAVSLAKAEGDYAIKAIRDAVRYAKKVTCGTEGSVDYLEVEKIGQSTAYYYLESDRIASKSGKPSATVAPGQAYLIQLTSDDVSVDTNGCSGSTLFSCPMSGGSVAICFNISNAGGIDVTDKSAAGTGGIRFQTYATNRNE